jgi:hypothetical protein
MLLELNKQSHLARVEIKIFVLWAYSPFQNRSRVSEASMMWFFIALVHWCSTQLVINIILKSHDDCHAYPYNLYRIIHAFRD